VANDFHELWNCPHCVGAVDGKRILLQAPINSGSLFYDYKQQYSIVLLALVDAKYRFLYVDVGANGRESDAGVYGNSKLSVVLEKNLLNLPEANYLPGTAIMAPYVVVGDDAFPMKPYLLKPFPDRLYDDTRSRVFNYRLSRASCVVENAFGILVNRWRVLRGRMTVEPQTAEKVVLATCVLHNFLSVTEGSRNTGATSDVLTNPLEFDERQCVRVATEQCENLLPLLKQGNRGYSMLAKEIRDRYTEYFNGPGKVPWPDKSSDI
jgi:DDE superfamily endonuclease